MRHFFALATLALLAGCASKRPPARIVEAEPDPWTVTTLDPKSKEPAWLSNGVIGIRIGRDGAGTDSGFFSIDAFESAGEERILPLPNPMAMRISVAGNDVSPLFSREYRQTLDFKTGRLTTTWKQPASGRDISVESVTSLDPGRARIDQKWIFLVSPGESAQLHFPLFGASSVKVTQPGEDDRTLEYEFGPSGARATQNFKMLGGWDGSWQIGNGKAVWAGRMLGSKQLILERTFSLDTSTSGPTDESLPRPVVADIEIEGPVEDQQAIRSFIHYLSTAISRESRMGTSPFGLSNTKYNGHVFWDADLWIFPAMALVAPDLAKVIPSYRIRTLPGARENFREWLGAGRPTANGRMGPPSNAQASPGVMFPWEGSVTGKETMAGPSRYQHHVTGSVAFGIDLATSLGLADVSSAREVLKGARTFYQNRVIGGGDVARRLPDTMSPDEFYVGDDDLYTNVIAQWCFEEGTFSREGKWQIYPGTIDMFLPRDAEGFLSYPNDPVKYYQQASAVLTIYPLQFPEAEKEARQMMARFEPKVTPNGPAMSDSIHALIWARLGEKERSYETWRKSWRDFTANPLMLYTEKRGTSAPPPRSSSGAGGGEETYFLTGAAGCLQTVIYGFLGFRIDDKTQPGAAWSIPLKNGKILNVKPNLPPAWKKVTFKNFSVLGKQYTLVAQGDKVEVHTETP